jgi:uncharacterized membrane protein YagU involved in acid resistance
MTVAKELSAKLQSSEEAGEESQGGEAPRDPWEQASMPAQVGRRIGEGLFHQDVAPERIPVLTHVMHWAYGTGWGAVYGVVRGSRTTDPSMRDGLAFGLEVWAMSYVELVPMGLYRLPWKYPAKDVATEVGFHLVYGAGTAMAFRLLDR